MIRMANNEPITRTLPVAEWLEIHNALKTNEYLARDEERMNEKFLNDGCRKNGISPEHYCDDCKRFDYDRAEAARRAMRYFQLAQKVIE